MPFAFSAAPRTVPIVGAMGVVPHPRDATRSSRIVSGPRHQSRDLVPLWIFLPAMEGAVVRVGVDPNVIAVLDTQRLRIQGMHVDVHFGNRRHPPVGAGHVSKGPKPDGNDVDVGWGCVRAVSILGRVEDEVVTVLPKRMVRF